MGIPSGAAAGAQLPKFSGAATSVNSSQILKYAQYYALYLCNSCIVGWQYTYLYSGKLRMELTAFTQLMRCILF